MNDRKQQVLITAKQLFVQNGFMSTTIQDILVEANISKGTFYNYFSSKNECLIAILKYGDEDIFVRRKELLIGQKISDKDVLAKQILARLQVNHEQNLLPIFQAFFHSDDKELRKFIKIHHFTEINWLNKRLIDVYGDIATPVAFDSATLLLGMIHQLFHVLLAVSKQKVDPSEIIHFTMRRMDAMIADMIETNDTLLQEKLSAFLYKGHDRPIQTKQQLHKEIQDFYEMTENDTTAECKQHIQFIIDEIRAEHPRTFVLQSVLRSFRECFIDTLHARDAQEITAKIWAYMKTLE